MRRWRRFDAQQLATTDGQPLEILHPGEWNTHAGPDFFNARIRLGDVGGHVDQIAGQDDARHNGLGRGRTGFNLGQFSVVIFNDGHSFNLTVVTILPFLFGGIVAVLG